MNKMYIFEHFRKPKTIFKNLYNYNNLVKNVLFTFSVLPSVNLYLFYVKMCCSIVT